MAAVAASFPKHVTKSGEKWGTINKSRTFHLTACPHLIITVPTVSFVSLCLGHLLLTLFLASLKTRRLIISFRSSALGYFLGFRSICVLDKESSVSSAWTLVLVTMYD